LFVALFPDVMPSTISSAYSLTTTNASATHYSLHVMTIVAIIFAPIVVVYEGWSYWIFRRRISTHHIPGAVVASDPLSQQT
jgi:cytochrome d ubiquinol oxidase subunit II